MAERGLWSHPGSIMGFSDNYSLNQEKQKIGGYGILYAFSSSSSSSSMSRQPEVEPWPPLNDASKLAYLEILFSSFSLSRSPCYLFPLH
jgi:hypothetical protein